tara:strand:+ start:883 stop:1035 length:153 start_codon:yes stop_codon:yes gene_type:complete
MEEKDLIKKLNKIDKRHKEILIMFSRLQTKKEKTYEQKCIELITKKTKKL